MKSLSKILSVAFLSLLFACGGNNSEKAASSNDSSHLESTAARTSSDAYIDKADAEAVSDAFHDYVKKESLTSFAEQHWISRCAFLALAAHIDKPEFDGVRIFWAADKDAKDATHLQWISTKGSSGNHLNQFGENISINCEFNSVEEGINIDPTTAQTQRERFWEFYRQQNAPLNLGDQGTRDSISAAVWFNKTDLLILKDILSNHPSLDGVNVHLGMTGSMNTTEHPGQVYPNQTTVYLIPSKANGTQHEDDWSAIDESKAKALNHGQMCLSICD